MSIVMNMSSYEIERDPHEAERDELVRKELEVAVLTVAEAALVRRPHIEPPGGWGGMDIDTFLDRMYVFRR